MTQAVVFGLGSLFNHSRIAQNVCWIRDISNRAITYRTLRDVKAGEELCISYGDHLTFIDVEAAIIDEADEDEVLSKIDVFSETAEDTL